MAKQNKGGGKAKQTPVNGYVAYILRQMGAPLAIQHQAQRIAVQNPGNLYAVLEYVRGTQWHAQVFPGFKQFVHSGLGVDEAGYNAWHRQIQDTVRQLGGRNYGDRLNADNIVRWAYRGWSATQVGQEIQGRQFAKVQGPEVQYETAAFGPGALSKKQVRQLGYQQSGLGSPQGVKLQNILDQAMQRAQTIFHGTIGDIGQRLGFETIAKPDLASGGG